MQEETLTKSQGDFLLGVVRAVLVQRLTGRGDVPACLDAPALTRPSGTFVTLKLKGQLRGCIGNIEPVDSIYDAVQRNALHAAFNDYRFEPLTTAELEKVHIDISILTPATIVHYSDAQDLLRRLRPGIDGVILRHGASGATFLPQVWDQLPRPEDFLGHLCRKAGLPEKTWRDAHPEILVYQVQGFEEQEGKGQLIINGHIMARLAALYSEMEREYVDVAAEIGLSCTGCPDNCCDSHFEHHTYVEWGYLWLGFSGLPAESQRQILLHAERYQAACAQAMACNQRPQAMCPLNQDGLCLLYSHRLLVCRTHGVPAGMNRPDGRRLEFPGCFRCQELVASKYANKKAVPRMERTPLLQKLAHLENELLGGRRHLYPKVKLTIAQMLLQGPPSIPPARDER